jgi:hypothetical protein
MGSRVLPVGWPPVSLERGILDRAAPRATRVGSGPVGAARRNAHLDRRPLAVSAANWIQHMIRTLLLFVLGNFAASAQIATDALVERIARRAETCGGSTFDVLILSGGGEYGAYGTGFLRGRKSRPSDSMPDFDMVTGISTGALIAPYAFLGDSESLAGDRDPVCGQALRCQAGLRSAAFPEA